jgi:hypothetical protein
VKPVHQAALGLAVFFATAGVVVFSLTLPHGTQFLAGIGWAWAIGRVMRWADSVDA